MYLLKDEIIKVKMYKIAKKLFVDTDCLKIECNIRI